MIYPNNLQLHTDGHPILRQVAEPVTEFDGFLNDFVTRMFERMQRWGGIGLAAPQVGVSKRIIVTCYRDQPLAWINPRIEKPTGRGQGEERCLSFPRQRALVERHRAFVLHYQNVAGARAKRHFRASKSDFLTVILQHEIDHLDGILLPDRALPGTFMSTPAAPVDPNESEIDRILRQL